MSHMKVNVWPESYISCPWKRTNLENGETSVGLKQGKDAENWTKLYRYTSIPNYVDIHPHTTI